MMYHLSESHMTFPHKQRHTAASAAAVDSAEEVLTAPHKCLCYYVEREEGEEDDDNDNNENGSRGGTHYHHHHHHHYPLRSTHAHDHSHALANDYEDDTNHPLCAVCVQRALKPHLDRHSQALADHARAKEDCAQRLNALPNNHARLGELQAQSRLLRDRLTTLRKQCADKAVRVAAQAVENDTRREATQHQLLLLRQETNVQDTHNNHNNNHNHNNNNSNNNTDPQVQLVRLEHSILQGSLHHALDVASRQVKILRFQWARKAFAMHRLYIDPNDTKLTPLQQHRRQKNSTSQEQTSSQGDTTIPTSTTTTSTDTNNHSNMSLPKSNKSTSSSTNTHTYTRRARGIGKIGGLPLPHAGPELYGVLPPTELQSALRLVASVTATVARCLGIVLPHPILLVPPTTNTTTTTNDTLSSKSSTTTTTTTASMSSPTTNDSPTSGGDITDTVCQRALQQRLRENHRATDFSSDSRSTTTSHVQSQHQQQQQQQQQHYSHRHSSAIPSSFFPTISHTNTTMPPPAASLSSSSSSAAGYWHSSQPAFGASSFLSLMDTSYWKQSAKKALARATGHISHPLQSPPQQHQHQQAPTPMEPSIGTFSSFPSFHRATAYTPTVPMTSQPTTFHTTTTADFEPLTDTSYYSTAPTPASSTFVPPSMDSQQLTLRIQHATAAIVAEDSSATSSKFALSVETATRHQQDFAIALQLLQNNIIVLCIRAGVDVAKLWPAEAVLLNLYQLDQYCQQQTAVPY